MPFDFDCKVCKEEVRFREKGSLACESCDDWYYTACMKVCQHMKSPNISWFCSSCLDGVKDMLKSLVFLVPTTALLLHFICRRNKIELCQGLLSLSLALCLNGVITNTIKVVVGRPRPDFFYRCFPDGKIDLEAVTDISQACKGEEATVIEGRKSFPSGHASFSFCSLGFLTLWLCGKLGVFRGSRSEGWKLVFAGSPLIVALIIALSRTCDYHHHWQDVFVGGLIGSLVSYLCYRQYYPRLSAPCCNLPYLLLPKFRRSHQESTFDVTTLANGRASSDMAFCDPESPMEEQVKWT